MARRQAVSLRRQSRYTLASNHWYVPGQGLGRGSSSSSKRVVLLHGLLGSARFWNPLLQYWRDDSNSFTASDTEKRPDLRVLAPDLLGFGTSPWPDVRYTVDEHLAALWPLLVDRCDDPSYLAGNDQNNRIHLIGHSFGGMLALEVAAKIPQHVASVTLLAFPYFYNRSDALHVLQQPRGMTLAKLFIRYRTLSRYLCHAVCQQRDRGWAHVLPKLPMLRRFPAEVVEDYLKHSFHSADSSFHHALLSHSSRPALQTVLRLGVPMSVMHAVHDNTVPVLCADRLAAECRGYPDVIVDLLRDPQATHQFPLSHLAETSQHVLRNICRAELI